MTQKRKFSPALVEAAKPKAEPYRIWDTVVPALFLRVQPSGVKSFNVQWSRTSSMSLGRWPGVTVAAARSRARVALVETDQHGAPAAVLEARKAPSEKPILLREFIAEHYGPWALANQKQGQATINALESQFGREAPFADLGDKPLGEVSAFDLERFKSARIKAGMRPATVNRDLDRIRSVFSRAVEWNWLSKHPMAGVKKIRGVDNSRVRHLSAAEEKRLRAALAKREAARRAARASGNEWREARGKPARAIWQREAFTDHLVPIVLLALNTGLRRGELFQITWENINFSTRQLTVPAGIAKSSKARHIPLNAEAFDTLKRWKGRDDRTGLVFPGGTGRLTNINKSWKAIAEAAGLQDFKFHDLRHSFASRMVQAGVDLYAVKELLGHSDFKMVSRYAHLEPEHLAAAVAKVSAR